jgi:virginiamycin B lyase
MLGGGGVCAGASRRACLLRALLVAATWLVVCVGAAPVSGAPIVSVYSSGLVVGGGPNVITAGRDGAMWFSQYSANRIGRITPDGTITQYPTSGSLTAGAHPSGIVAGPDGKIWFSEYGIGRIGELDPATGLMVGEYPLPAGAASQPEGITVGRDGAIWFTERGANQVGRLDPAAVSPGTSNGITEYLLTTSDTQYQPVDLVTGQDGALWITELFSNQVARLDPALATPATTNGVTTFTLPTIGSEPEGITAAADGMLWVAEYGSDQIARVDPALVSDQTTNGITEYPANGKPLWVSTAHDGAIWFTDNSNGQLLRFDTTTNTATSIAAAQGVAGDVTSDAVDTAGNLWFTTFTNNTIGQVGFVAENTSLPVVAGVATVGHALSCSPGSWTNQPGSYSYQWKLAGQPIPGETAPTYTIAAAAAGLQLTCQVTAQRLDGSTSATSAAVVVGANAPANTTAPAVTGLVAVGQTVTCANGSWSNTPTTFAYQWFVDGGATAGQTSETHLISASEAGRRISCQVTATNSGGSGSALSAAVTAAVGVGNGSGVPTVNLRIRRARVGVGTPVILDASATQANGAGIVSYTVTFGAGGGSATCDGQAPIMRAVFGRPVAGPATLTVTTSSGVSARVSAPFVVAAAARPAARRGIRPVPSALVSYLCTPPPSSPPHRGIPEPGFPMAEICGDSVHAGLIDANGCLDQVDFASLPAADQTVISAFAAFHVAVHHKAAADRPGNAPRSTLVAGVTTHIQQSPFLKDDAFYITRAQPVQINGLTYQPNGNDGAIVIAVAGPVFSTTLNDPGAVYVISANAIVKVEGIPVRVGAVTLAAGFLDGARVHLADYEFDDNLYPIHLPGLPDFPVTGSMSVDLVKQASLLGLNVELPKVFNDPAEDALDDTNKIFGKQGAHGVTAAVTLRIANRTGLVADHFEFNVPRLLQLGGVTVRNLHFVYDRPTRLLSGGVLIDVPSVLSGGIAGNVTFVHSDFAGATLGYVASYGEGLPIVGPVYLTEISGTLSLPPGADPPTVAFPSAFGGDATFSIGPSASSQGCGLASVHGTATLHFAPAPFSITATGENQIFCLDLGEKYFQVDATGHVLLGEDWKLPLPFITGALTANLDGQALIDPADGRFHIQLDGSGSFGIDIGYVIGSQHLSIANATAVISDEGAALCGSALGYTVGIGESFNPPPLNQVLAIKNLSLNMGGCDIASYQPLGAGGRPGTARGRAAASSYAFTVPAGERTVILQLKGAGGAPRVTLHGPAGRVIDTAVGVIINSDEFVAPQQASATTLIELRGRNAGRWTLVPDAGSPRVVTASVTHEVGKPRITGYVTGRGNQRVLHYALTPQVGMRVRFVERGVGGATTIGVAHAASGRIRFTPSDAHRGTRMIIAVIDENGMPRPSVTITRYVAAAPRAGRPTRLTARRVGATLRVAFGPAPLATAYHVLVWLGDGRVLLYALPARTRRLAIPNVRRGERVVVSVVGLYYGTPGPRIALGVRHL